MKVGDLVRNLSSESGLLGVIVERDPGWDELNDDEVFIVCWQDGRTGPVVARKMKIIKES